MTMGSDLEVCVIPWFNACLTFNCWVVGGSISILWCMRNAGEILGVFFGTGAIFLNHWERRDSPSGWRCHLARWLCCWWKYWIQSTPNKILGKWIGYMCMILYCIVQVLFKSHWLCFPLFFTYYGLSAEYCFKMVPCEHYELILFVLRELPTSVCYSSPWNLFLYVLNSRLHDHLGNNGIVKHISINLKEGFEQAQH